MKRLFSKDECAPDAPTLRDFQVETGIGLESSDSKPKISIEYEDFSNTYLVDKEGRYLRETYSCGVYEDLYQFDSEEEYLKDIVELLKQVKVVAAAEEASEGFVLYKH